jgi:hypothetical protein
MVPVTSCSCGLAAATNPSGSESVTTCAVSGASRRSEKLGMVFSSTIRIGTVPSRVATRSAPRQTEALAIIRCWS